MISNFTILNLMCNSAQETNPNSSTSNSHNTIRQTMFCYFVDLLMCVRNCSSHTTANLVRFQQVLKNVQKGFKKHSLINSSKLITLMRRMKWCQAVTSMEARGKLSHWENSMNIFFLNNNHFILESKQDPEFSD